MKNRLLNILACPDCKGEFKLEIIKMEKDEIITGRLRCANSHIYEIINGIPRFVASDNYVGSFSYEWDIFGDTLLDSRNKEKFSVDYFNRHMNRPLEHLKNKLTLDAGCGMGHFMEIVALRGAEVVGVDLSYAVDTAQRLIGHLPNAHLIQADIFALPFKDGTFDFIYSFGVLHHTPDCKNAFSCLPKLLKSDGEISISLYAYNAGIVLSSEFWRLFTTRMPKKVLYYFSYLAYPLYYLYAIPILGKILRCIFFVPDIKNWKRRHLEMFDWYSPHYQSNHSGKQLAAWFEENAIFVTKIFKEAASVYGKKS